MLTANPHPANETRRKLEIEKPLNWKSPKRLIASVFVLFFSFPFPNSSCLKVILRLGAFPLTSHKPSRCVIKSTDLRFQVVDVARRAFLMILFLAPPLMAALSLHVGFFSHLGLIALPFRRALKCSAVMRTFITPPSMAALEGFPRGEIVLLLVKQSQRALPSVHTSVRPGGAAFPSVAFPFGGVGGGGGDG